MGRRCQLCNILIHQNIALECVQDTDLVLDSLFFPNCVVVYVCLCMHLYFFSFQGLIRQIIITF